MSYLYLLVDGAGDGFKIGVSTDPSQRMASLPEIIDAEKSFQIKCGEKNSYRVEKTLHLLFRNHHLKKERGDGYTEWFSMDCFDAVKDFIRSQRDLLGWTCFEPIPKPKISHYQVHQTDEEKLNRKVANAEKKETEFIEYLERNQKTVNAMSDWISSIREQNTLIGVFNANYFGVRTFLVILGEDEGSQYNAHFPYYSLNSSSCSVAGGMSLTTTSISLLNYTIVALGDLDCFKRRNRNDGIIQPLLEIIETIPFIVEPRLIEVLVEFDDFVNTQVINGIM